MACLKPPKSVWFNESSNKGRFASVSMYGRSTGQVLAPAHDAEPGSDELGVSMPE